MAKITLRVDRDASKVKVERVFASHDCGQVINPNGSVNQIEGGVREKWPLPSCRRRSATRFKTPSAYGCARCL